jgi:hypothetical protein
MLNRFLLIIPLAIPLCGYSQGYADSPFYKIVSAVPSTARAVGGEKMRTRANGIGIDVSMLEPAPFTPRLTNVWADRSTPEHIFHYFRQYDELNAVFGYDLRVEPIQGTNQIRCTFTALSDPIDQPPSNFQRWGLGLRKKSIPVVALSGDLRPFVIKSGDAISITTLPLGPGKIAVVQYLRLTRTDLAHDSDSPQ